MIINLLVAGIAEGGIYQASDVIEHLKTGHLVGASPKDLFYGQVIGSVLGALLCSCVYKLFTSAYIVPSEQFNIPQARLWLVSARLAYGRGLPPGALAFAVAGFVIAACTACVRMFGAKKSWVEYIPSGTAIGIGMSIDLLRHNFLRIFQGFTFYRFTPSRSLLAVSSTFFASERLTRRVSPSSPWPSASFWESR